jgi:peptide/nickel transport system permease protein
LVEPSKGVGRHRNTTVGRFVAQRSGVFGVVLLVGVLFAAGAGGRLWRYHYDDITAQYSSAPSSQHPMGTDTIGHDVLAQVLRGLQKSMEVAVVAALVSTAAGVVIGGVGGYFGGLAEGLLMRLADVALIIPGIAALAVLAASVQDVPGNWLLIALILSGLLWARTARIVRAAVASLREEAFVEAARASGAGPGRIIARHILPGTAGLVITAATLTLATAVQAEAAMTFLGLGITLPDTSLGRLVAVGSESATTRPWLFYFPGLAIVVVVVATNFVGDALRRALDRRADAGSALGP